LEIDVHIHSCHSLDSRSKPEEIVRRSLDLGLGAIAVTDHNSWKGYEAAKGAAKGRLIVIPGAELRTDKGDLIALFATDIQARAWEQAIEEIKAGGGICVVPHPAASPDLTKDDIALADAIEVFNSTCGGRANREAQRLAEELHKPGFGSSDAHIVSAIGNGRTKVFHCSSVDDLRQHILKQPEVTRRQRTNPLAHYGNAVLCFGLKGLWKK